MSEIDKILHSAPREDKYPYINTEEQIQALFERDKNHVLPGGYGIAYAYREAINGEGRDDFGSLGYQWADKPHRLVFDLFRVADLYRSEVEGLRSAPREDKWVDVRQELRAQPCNFQTYAGEGNIDFCALPLGHDNGIHEDRITDAEIEQKWAELNDDDGDIRVMAMLHELLKLRNSAPPVSKDPVGEEGLVEFPASTCVECGRKIPAGQMQKCNTSDGGFCTWRIPTALHEFMRSGRLKSKQEDGGRS